MGRTFKLDKDPYGCDETLYTKRKVTIESGVTILVGTNGSGKTTLLNHYIKDQLNNEGIPCMMYNNIHDGGNYARQAALNRGKMTLLAELACSSEGEQIYLNIGTMAEKIGRFIRSNPGATEMWFLFDAIDSGFSIDNIIEVKESLFKTIIDTNPNTNIYIIVSANSYEMCRGEQCLDVTNCKYRTFKTYEAYRKFIIKSKEYKIKRYNKE